MFLSLFEANGILIFVKDTLLLIWIPYKLPVAILHKNSEKSGRFLPEFDPNLKLILMCTKFYFITFSKPGGTTENLYEN